MTWEVLDNDTNVVIPTADVTCTHCTQCHLHGNGTYREEFKELLMKQCSLKAFTECLTRQSCNDKQDDTCEYSCGESVDDIYPQDSQNQNKTFGTFYDLCY